MGESSACLVRSFFEPSPTSSEEKKRNPIQRALTSSISFGRFMSESLDWEKFSAFTQNRHLEEVEKYSKPGSVAEKKAYFEAHYKRRRAAAFLEQQNAEVNDFPKPIATNEVENNSSRDSELAQRDNYEATEKTKEGDICVYVGESGICDEEIDGILEDNVLERVKEVTESFLLIEKPIELTSIVENDGCCCISVEEDKACKKDASTTSISASSSEKNPEDSSHETMKNVCASTKRTSKSSSEKKPEDSSREASKNISASTTRILESSSEKKLEDSSHEAFKDSAFKPVPSVKPIMPVPLRKNENNERNSNNKMRSNSTSLHMSINFASCAGEIQKAKSQGPPKIPNSRLVGTPVKKSQNNMVSQNLLTRASVNGTFKNYSATPSSQNRTINLHHDSIPGSKVMEKKLQFLSAAYSKASNTIGSKARSPTVSSSFTFKSEERAAKRKEFFQKLELKFKANKSDKQQQPPPPPPAKPQVRSGNDLKDQYKTTKNTGILCKMEPPTNLAKKQITKSSTIPCSPKIKERAAAFRVHDNNDSRPPWRFSAKTGNSLNDVFVTTTGKNNRPPIYFAKSFLRKSTCENASPNIQL